MYQCRITAATCLKAFTESHLRDVTGTLAELTVDVTELTGPDINLWKNIQLFEKLFLLRIFKMVVKVPTACLTSTNVKL